MKNMNRVTLIGQLAADPEVKTVPSGNTVASFRMATNYSWKDSAGEWKQGADFHRIVAWEKLAEQVAQSCKKGRRVFVEGKLRTRSFTDSTNQERFVTEVVAHAVLPMISTAYNRHDEEVEQSTEGCNDPLEPVEATAGTGGSAEEVVMPLEPEVIPV